MEELIRRLDEQEKKIDDLVKKIHEIVDQLQHKPKSDYVGNQGVSIIKYKKSIVVTGNTKPLKNTMKENHGRWNPRLKDEEGKTFCGWIFTTSNIQDLIDSIKEEGIEPTVSQEVLEIVNQ